MVIMFHAAPGLFSGGYIGVDVFFVIPGFLITGLLVRELQKTGRVDLARFYVRRFRRLLPAAALAIGVTFLLSALIIPPLDLPRVAGDGVSAAVSIANIRFALASGGYFSAIATPSPFLHYWSLSVEEQFYLVWPALLIVASSIARGPRGAAMAVALVALLSLVGAILLTDVAANWAFFSLPTRAWQLAVGGLLAITAIRSRRVGSLSGGLVLMGWLGLGAVILAGYSFDAWLAYPGVWALIPTLGAVAIIVAGDRRFGPGLLLRTVPLRFFGRISYALYLWHWPLLVLPAIAFGGELPIWDRAALVLLAILVATASTVFVEEPIRRGSAVASGRRQLVVAGALGIALLSSVTAGLGIVTWVTQAAISESRRDAVALVGSDAPRRDPDGPLAAEKDPLAEWPADAVVEMGRDLDAPWEVADDIAEGGRISRSAGLAVPPPTEPTGEAPGATPAPTPEPSPAPRPPRRARPIISLPADVRPSLWDAREDEELLRRNGCLEAESATMPRRCVFGDVTSNFVVALVGDSHASHWFPAIKKVADDLGWRLETFVKVSCPFTDIPVRNLQLKRAYSECGSFNTNTVDALGRIKPDLVITALFRYQYPIRSSDESALAQGAGIARMLNRVPGKKVIIADVPFPGHDVPACLSKNLDDVRPCAVASYHRTSGGSPDRERIAAKRSDGAVVNFTAAICGGAGDCPVVSNDMIVYRDTHHLTATYSRWLAPAMERALTRILRPRS
jgi:peptidoglycan/LPS O-acetylase OafA/YrhL